MRQFKNVATYASSCDSAEKLVAMSEDYAKSKANLLFATKYGVIETNKEGIKIGIDDKARQLNEVFCSELARRSKYTLDDFDGDVQAYASYGAVASMSAQIQKIIVDAMTPILINASGLNAIAEFHYGGYGDVFEFEVNDRYPYEVSKMGRRQKHTKIQEKKKINKTISTDFYGLTTMATLPQILLGEAMIAEDAFLMALSIEKKIYTLVVKKFIEVSGNMADSRFVVTNYTEAGVLEKLRNASAWNGSPVVLVGDAVALKTVLPASERVRILLQDEFNTTLGYMSTFNTYKVLAFDVVADENETSGVLGLPTDKLYGIPVDGSKLIHVAIGATISNTDDAWDNDNLSVMSTLRKELGVDLATNKKIVRVDL